ncbi:hypothetical protein [Crateriforma spongiae]|uniref:hypothetical protein n=1 Tax=Crateriforma spongiae TaxID=2724528 RepID=UPI0014450AB8|nr:hypothetical protein [Crateriforma spongiae]
MAVAIKTDFEAMVPNMKYDATPVATPTGGAISTASSTCMRRTYGESAEIHLWQNVTDHLVGAVDLPLSNRPDSPTRVHRMVRRSLLALCDRTNHCGPMLHDVSRKSKANHYRQ